MELWSILSLNEEISKKNEVEGRGSMAGGCGIGSGGCWLVKNLFLERRQGWWSVVSLDIGCLNVRPCSPLQAVSLKAEETV